MRFRNIIAVISAGMCLSACAKQECRMLENAAPENSAMTIYCFDGENTNIKWRFDRNEEQKIISEINQLKTRSANSDRLSEMDVPCYGIEISDTDGYDIWLTYSNGLWLLKDGTVYEADYDFNKLYDNISDAEPEIMRGGIGMPNSAYLCEYDKRYYEKSDDLYDSKDNITMSVTSVEGKSVIVKLENNSDADYCYGEHFRLQKKIDDVWYIIPVKLSNYAFNDLGYILNAHESQEMACDLTPYGELSPGIYRIEKENMAAEFVI